MQKPSTAVMSTQLHSEAELQSHMHMLAHVSCSSWTRPSRGSYLGLRTTLLTGIRLQLTTTARAAGSARSDGPRYREGPLRDRLGLSRSRPQTLPPPATQSSPPVQQRYYVTCHPGLEEVVAAELRSPQIRAGAVRPGKAGVSFIGDAATGYRANLWLRSAIRVLQFLAEGDLDPRRSGGDEIYRTVAEALDWTNLLQQGQSFSVEARARSCTEVPSSQLVVVRAKDAICDFIRNRRGAKPLPPEAGRTADLPLYLTAFQDRLAIFRDLSGVSLHRRGYRRAMHRASLNESAAAGLLYLAGWDQLCSGGGDAVLADPMCGSGTILIEAALMASCTAPGLFRRWWPCQAWPDFDRQAWEGAFEEAAGSRRAPAPGVVIWGNDSHPAALALALRDVESARVAAAVRLQQGGCREWALPGPPQLVVSNPPWGQRLMGVGNSGGAEWGSLQFAEVAPRGREELGEEPGVEELWDASSAGTGEEGAPGHAPLPTAAMEQQDLAQAWHDLSVFLKEQCGGAEAYLLSGNADATKHLRLRAEKKWALSIGGVDCRLLKYSIRGRAAPAANPAAPL